MEIEQTKQKLLLDSKAILEKRELISNREIFTLQRKYDQIRHLNSQKLTKLARLELQESELSSQSKGKELPSLQSRIQFFKEKAKRESEETQKLEYIRTRLKASIRKLESKIKREDSEFSSYCRMAKLSEITRHKIYNQYSQTLHGIKSERKLTKASHLFRSQKLQNLTKKQHSISVNLDQSSLSLAGSLVQTHSLKQENQQFVKDLEKLCAVYYQNKKRSHELKLKIQSFRDKFDNAIDLIDKSSFVSPKTDTDSIQDKIIKAWKIHTNFEIRFSSQFTELTLTKNSLKEKLENLAYELKILKKNEKIDPLFQYTRKKFLQTKASSLSLHQSLNSPDSSPHSLDVIRINDNLVLKMIGGSMLLLQKITRLVVAVNEQCATVPPHVIRSLKSNETLQVENSINSQMVLNACEIIMDSNIGKSLWKLINKYDILVRLLHEEHLEKYLNKIREFPNSCLTKIGGLFKLAYKEASKKVDSNFEVLHSLLAQIPAESKTKTTPTSTLRRGNTRSTLGVLKNKSASVDEKNYFMKKKIPRKLPYLSNASNAVINVSMSMRDLKIRLDKLKCYK